VNQLWLQEKVNNGEIKIEKVMGVLNRADALTEPKDGKILLQHLDWTSQVVTKGRNEHAPKLANTDPLKNIMKMNRAMNDYYLTKSAYMFS